MLAWIRTLAARTRAWLSPTRADRDFEDELAAHLEMLAEENLRRGMTREQAERAARLRLGGHAQLMETHRELRGLPALDALLQDARHGLRALGSNPGFTAVAVLTLALGVGANTAIFSVVHAVLLKPLPYASSEELHNVFQLQPEQGVTGTGWSYPNFTELREQATVFSELAAVQQHQLTLTGRGEPAVVNTSVVTPELFSLFDARALAGRTLRSEDGRPGAPAVVVLSESLWRGALGADPGVIGSALYLDKRPFQVVGIMPAAFRFPLLTGAAQVWIPLAHDPLFGSWMSRRAGHWLQVTARLKRGVTVAEAQAELDALAGRLARSHPAENAGWAIRMAPLRQLIAGDARAPLLALLGAVALVLLIACANVANLLLARATSRAREIAVRAALGASRARIVRQLLSEAAALGLLGGAAGIALAYLGVQSLLPLLPPGLTRVNEIRVDPLVLGFACLVAVAAACFAGLVPALSAAYGNPGASVREGGSRSGEPASRRRARRILAGAEIALAIVLLVGAGLLLRSFARLTAVSPGFEVQHLVKADISLPRFAYSAPQQWNAFSDELLARLHAEPGLRDAAVAVPRPIADGCVVLPFDVVGSPATSSSVSRTAEYVSVSPGYFRVMGIPVLGGRAFDRHDVASSPRVTIISRALARAHFPGQDPLGRRLAFAFPPGARGEEREIVGVVADVRAMGLGEKPGPMMYVPYAQEPFWGANLVVRSRASRDSVASTIRRTVQRMDKDLPVTDVATMPDVLAGSLAQPRFRTLLLGLFALMALALAATGIFGVISYSVSCRTNEIGIRVALGASRGAILRMVLRETLALTLGGLAVGVPCALLAARLIERLLFDVAAHDPATLFAVALVLSAVALLAGLVPARRATRVEAMAALRHE